MYYSGMNWPIRKINIFESQRRNATTIIIDDEQTHTTRHQTGLGCVLPAACGCLSGTLAQRGLNGSTNGSHERVGRTFFTSVCAFAAWLGCRAVFFFFFFVLPKQILQRPNNTRCGATKTLLFGAWNSTTTKHGEYGHLCFRRQFIGGGHLVQLRTCAQPMPDKFRLCGRQHPAYMRH